jgi:hypothetical protein
VPLTFLQPQNPRIFISYRRADTDTIVGRITDRLTEHFGRARVFRDVDNLTSGARYRTSIEEALARCDIFLAVIGPHWVDFAQLRDPADLMRNEIETALSRGIVVIPVLVDGAKMPNVDQLPQSLHTLTEFQAHAIGPNRDFNRHIQELIETIENHTRFTSLQMVVRSVRAHRALSAAIGVTLVAAFSIAIPMLLGRDIDHRQTQAAVRECNRSLGLDCARKGGVSGSSDALASLRACRAPQFLRSDEPQLQWNDIWTTDVYSFQPGGGGPGGGKDDDELKVGGWGDWYFSLIRFRVPPTHRRPKFVGLALYAKENDGASVPINLDRLISRWDFPKGGTLWWRDRPGQRAVTTDPLPAPKKDEWYVIDVTALVNDWVDGKFENFGLQLRPAHQFGSFNFFVSSDSADKSKIPRLILCD